MGSIITIEANCRDCYKCIRNCPVKAIKIVGNHSIIIDDMCIGDGECVRVCPQKSKEASSSIDDVMKILSSEKLKLLSVAPTFVAAYDLIDPKRLVSAARKLGFDMVFETAQAAGYVAKAHEDLINDTRPILSSSCPVIVNYVEKYKPMCIKNLAKVVSPMIAHSKVLRKKHNEDVAVVFLGPCIAKKDEILRDDIIGNVDAVLTFVEFKKMCEEAGISIERCEIGDFDGDVFDRARLYPLEGGMFAALDVSLNLVDSADLTVTGIEDCIQFINNIDEHTNYRMVELMACSGGCSNGPGMECNSDIYNKRSKILKYERDIRKKLENAKIEFAGENFLEGSEPFDLDLTARYVSREVHLPSPSDDEIRKILKTTDKHSDRDELNCGACGYNSCKDKAIAVYRGMADVEMCLPFMRQQAESMSSFIINATPNGVVVVDKSFRIISVNPAFENLFNCSLVNISGNGISRFINESYFKEVFDSKSITIKEIRYNNDQSIAHVKLFYVDKREVVVALITDITKERMQREAILKTREDILIKTNKVINRQMQVAQEIAGLLGETTAETKVLLTQLKRQLQDEELTEL